VSEESVWVEGGDDGCCVVVGCVGGGLL